MLPHSITLAQCVKDFLMTSGNIFLQVADKDPKGFLQSGDRGLKSESESDIFWKTVLNGAFLAYSLEFDLHYQSLYSRVCI